MRRPASLTAAIASAVVLIAVSIYFRSWGGIALVVTCAAGFAWYRVQVARSEAAEQFFGEQGEETRMTNFQGGSPSEMPVDRAPGSPPELEDHARH